MNQQEKFISIFNFTDTNELIRWADANAVGFSLIKEYPKEIKFNPIKKPDGSNDSIALIKIGYINDKIENNEVKLLVTISKASRYIFDHYFYNFNDPLCPQKESIIASEKSQQPVDLEAYNRYIFNINENTIKDTDNNKIILGNDIIEEIWKTHLKSITYLPFRSKLKIKKTVKKIADYITPNKFPDKIAPFLKSVLNIIGWELNSDKEDFLLGITKPYSFKFHMRKKESEKIAPLGIPLDKKPTFISMFLIFIILVANFYFKYDFLQIINFITNQINDNIVFQIAFLVTIVYSIDFIIPRFILWIINLSICLRNISLKSTKIS